MAKEWKPQSVVGAGLPEGRVPPKMVVNQASRQVGYDQMPSLLSHTHFVTPKICLRRKKHKVFTAVLGTILRISI
jgi:hypothetical protein